MMDITTDTPQLYWHFCKVDDDDTPRLGYRDKREVKVGETLRVEGKPVLCQHGLHASMRVRDALSYARNNGKMRLCRVALGGTVYHDESKSVGNERTVIAMLDTEATERLLRDYARWCALQVIHLWNAPDIVRQYLETGDESLRRAAAAAADAATYASAAAASAAAAAYAAADADAAAYAAAAAYDAADADAAAYAAAYAAARKSYAEELERRSLEALSQ